MEILLCATADYLAWSKNLCGGVMLNAILLTPLLTKVVILDGQSSTTEIFKTFTVNIA